MTESLPSEYKGRGTLKSITHTVQKGRELGVPSSSAARPHPVAPDAPIATSRQRHTPVFVPRQYRGNQYSEIEIRSFQLFLLHTFDACTGFCRNDVLKFASASEPIWCLLFSVKISIHRIFDLLMQRIL